MAKSKSQPKIKQRLLLRKRTIDIPEPSAPTISREDLIKTVKERGGAWAIAALIDGSCGYYVTESAQQMIKALMKGETKSASERCMACFHCDLLAEIDHDFRYFGGKDEYAPARVRLLTAHVKEVLRLNRQRGRPRPWITQSTFSAMYPTMRIG